MDVRMLDVELQNAPRLISRRPGHGQALLQRELVSCIYSGGGGNPPPHPQPSRSIFETKKPRGPSAAGSHSCRSKKYFCLPPPDSPQSWGMTPNPTFPSPQPFLTSA